MLIHELAKATDESRQQSSAMESAKRKAVEMEKELSSANSALAAANQVLEERGQKLLNVKLQLEKERSAFVFMLGTTRKWQHTWIRLYQSSYLVMLSMHIFLSHVV